MAGIPLFSGPQDPSQLQNLLNQVLTTIGGYVAPLPGQSGPITPIQAGTTSANLPASGLVTLSSTVASAQYTISRPILGQTVKLVTITTKAQTVAAPTGVTFNKGNTKLTFKTTNGAAGVEVWQAAELTALSTSVWALTGSIGTIKST